MACGPGLERLQQEAVAISYKNALRRSCCTWSDYLMFHDGTDMSRKNSSYLK